MRIITVNRNYTNQKNNNQPAFKGQFEPKSMARLAKGLAKWGFSTKTIREVFEEFK